MKQLVHKLMNLIFEVKHFASFHTRFCSLEGIGLIFRQKHSIIAAKSRKFTGNIVASTKGNGYDIRLVTEATSLLLPKSGCAQEDGGDCNHAFCHRQPYYFQSCETLA